MRFEEPGLPLNRSLCGNNDLYTQYVISQKDKNKEMLRKMKSLKMKEEEMAKRKSSPLAQLNKSKNKKGGIVRMIKVKQSPI